VVTITHQASMVCYKDFLLTLLQSCYSAFREFMHSRDKECVGMPAAGQSQENRLGMFGSQFKGCMSMTPMATAEPAAGLRT
jgi:hypothetical protein